MTFFEYLKEAAKKDFAIGGKTIILFCLSALTFSQPMPSYVATIGIVGGIAMIITASLIKTRSTYLVIGCIDGQNHKAGLVKAKHEDHARQLFIANTLMMSESFHKNAIVYAKVISDLPTAQKEAIGG